MGVAGMFCHTGSGTDREMLLGANCSNVAVSGPEFIFPAFTKLQKKKFARRLWLFMRRFISL